MKREISRRGFIRNSSALAATAASVIGKVKNASAHSYYGAGCDSHVKPFMNQYYDGMVGIIKGIRDTQVEKIGHAMEKAYELKQKGGTVYSIVVYSKFAAHASGRDLPGQPWVLPQYTSVTKELIDSMKKGDFLLTSIVDMGMKKARERGVFVAGVINSFFRFYKTPKDALNLDYRKGSMELSVEEMSNLVIDSQVPWDNGLVSAPQQPRFKLCPSTGTAQILVYWACTASLANLIRTKGKGSSTEPVRRYLDLALERFRCIGTDRPKIDRITSKWADLVLEKGARLLLCGEKFGAGGRRGRNMFVNASIGAASGTMIAQENTGDVSKNDIVLIGSIRSDNPDEIEYAREARLKGAYTVAFCPYTTEGDASGTRLYKEVDDALNTYCDERAGVISVPGTDEKISPLTGVAGNLIHWMLTAQWTYHLARRGEMPYYYQGYNEIGGREYDSAIKPYFLKRGY